MAVNEDDLVVQLIMNLDEVKLKSSVKNTVMDIDISKPI